MEQFKKILHKSIIIVFPDHISPNDLTNTFGHLFSDKIMKIRIALQSSVPVSTTRPRSNNSALSSFEPLSEDAILKTLNSSLPNQPYLIPTSLVKECADILITAITNINYCKKGVYRTASKPHVTPLLKKPSLELNGGVE